MMSLFRRRTMTQGAEKLMRKIADVTLESDTSNWEIETDMDGKPLKLKEVGVEVYMKGTDTGANVYLTLNGTKIGTSVTYLNSERNGAYHASLNEDGTIEFMLPGSILLGTTTNIKYTPVLYKNNELKETYIIEDAIKKVGFFTYQTIAAGARIVVYGR